MADGGVREYLAASGGETCLCIGRNEKRAWAPAKASSARVKYCTREDMFFKILYYETVVIIHYTERRDG